jgi:hypothetical protein
VCTSCRALPATACIHLSIRLRLLLVSCAWVGVIHDIGPGSLGNTLRPRSHVSAKVTSITTPNRDVGVRWGPERAFESSVVLSRSKAVARTYVRMTVRSAPLPGLQEPLRVAATPYPWCFCISSVRKELCVDISSMFWPEA